MLRRATLNLAGARSAMGAQRRAAITLYAIPTASARDYSSKRKNFAVVATGLGFLDGTDITEASSLMVHMGSFGFSPVFFSPDGLSEETIDHSTRETDKNEIRDIQVEVSRLSRAKVLSLNVLRGKAAEVLTIPGGGGLAMLLPGFKDNNKEFDIVPSLESAIKEFHSEGKVIIATGNGVIPVARVLGTKNGGPGVKLAVGDDAELEDIVLSLGATPVTSKAQEAVMDEVNHITSAGGFSNRTASFHDVHEALGKAVRGMASMGRGVKEVEIDWDFHDFYITKARGYTREEWEIIKADLQAMVERQQKRR